MFRINKRNCKNILKIKKTIKRRGNVIYIDEELIGGANDMGGVISVFDVANYFLSKEPMTHKKLQKLCYYAQAWYLALFDKELFCSDFEAWVHGPVCPDLYYKYREHKWNEIPKSAQVPEIDDDLVDFLEEVFVTYGEFSGDELEILTHSEDPWKKAREGCEDWEPSNKTIDKKVMRDYYWMIYEKHQGN